MGIEREKERYLCILCDETLYCVDLANNNNKEEIQRGEIANVIFSVNFEGGIQKIPYGMRSFEFPIGSGNTYLIGGEYLQKSLPEPPSSWDLPLSWTRGGVELNMDIFKLTPPQPQPQRDYYFDLEVFPPASKKAKLSDDIEFYGGGVTLKKMKKTKDVPIPVPAMNAGKGEPIIERIGDKFYVIHSRNRLFGLGASSPAFEVLEQDQTNGQPRWRALPQPPFYTQFGRECTVLSTAAFADRFFCVNAFASAGLDAYAWFDTVNETWSSVDTDISCYCTTYLPKPLYTSSSQLDNYYYVAISLIPYDQPCTALLVNSNGAVVCQQTLQDLFKPTIYGSSFFNLRLEGDNRMCSIRSTPGYYGSTCLEIKTFSVNPCPGVLPIIDKLSKDRDRDTALVGHRYLPPPPEFDFVRLNIERQYSLTIPGSLNDSSLPNAEHAFFL